MCEKIKIGIIFIFLFCIINYFIYNIVLNTYFTNIINNRTLLFFILSTFVSILFFTFYLLLKERKIGKFLNKRLKYLNEDFQNRLEYEIKNSKAKDKIIYEQLKLTSMNELISNIAHHWRQPLSVISTAATSIQLYEKMGKLETKDVLSSCTLINKKAQYLSQTIDSFKDFSKKRKSKDIFRLQDLMNNFLDLSKALEIEVIYTIEKDITLYTDKNELIEVLINIINNSKESFEREQIVDRFVFLDIFIDEEIITIKIKDTAGGIAKDIIYRVFEPYFTTKHKSEGTGLGLYFSYIIIKNKLDGAISVKNVDFEYLNKEYKGALFSIVFPIK